jgi:hypothetical protein
MTFSEGEWTYTKADGEWTATHTRTGQTVGPQCTVPDLRRLVFEASRGTNPVITVVGGAGRALSARRYTKAFAA